MTEAATTTATDSKQTTTTTSPPPSTTATTTDSKTTSTDAKVTTPSYKAEEVETWKASHDKLSARHAKVPLNAGDYALDVDEKIAWGEGKPFKIAADSLIATKGREWAKSVGLTPDEFKAGLSLFGEGMVDMYARAEQSAVAEGEKAMARLADPALPEADRVPAGLARAQRVEKYLTDHKLEALAEHLDTPEKVLAMEKMIERAGGPRSGPALAAAGAADDTKKTGKQLRAEAWAESKRA